MIVIFGIVLLINTVVIILLDYSKDFYKSKIKMIINLNNEIIELNRQILERTKELVEKRKKDYE